MYLLTHQVNQEHFFSDLFFFVPCLHTYIHSGIRCNDSLPPAVRLRTRFSIQIKMQDACDDQHNYLIDLCVNFLCFEH